MTINPYEPPQTIERALPQASPVSNVPAKLEILAIGTAHCAGAGRLYLLGSGGCLLYVLFRIAMDAGYRHDPLVYIPMVCCMVASFIMFGWGLLKNLTGLINLRANAPNQKIRRIYSVCLHICWLKVPVFLLLLTTPRSYFMPHALDTMFWEVVPNVCLIGCWLITILWHKRAINSLVKLLGVARPKYTAMLYFLTGTATLLALITCLYFLRFSQDAPWVLLLVGLLAVHNAAYTRAYAQLSRAFRAEVVL